MDTAYLVFDHQEGSASEAVSSVAEERQPRDQPFRIYRIVPEPDQITVYARHVFYDLLDNMIKAYDIPLSLSISFIRNHQFLPESTWAVN